MLCEKCHLRQATIHLTEIIKDVKSELHLCESCAKDVGLNSKLSNFTLSIPEMLSFLDVNELDQEKNVIFCKTCGLHYTEFRKKGTMGCPDCYIYFKDHLEPVILSFHGEKRHIGKNPHNSSTKQKGILFMERKDRTNNIAELQEELSKALSEERYEEAAVIRDRLKELQ